MKKPYSISRGQLISVWIFGFIAWIWATDSYSDFSEFLTIFIPFSVIFYTIGWRNAHKQKEEGVKESDFDYEFVKNFLDSFKKSGGTGNAEGEALYEVIKLQFEQGKYSEARSAIIKVTRLLSEEARKNRSQ